MKTRCLNIIAGLVLVVMSVPGVSYGLTYDFTVSDASILDNVTTGTYVVNGVALSATAGAVDTVGNFNPGGGGTKLCTSSAGLGVNRNPTCTQVGDDTHSDSGIAEAVLFGTDPLFVPEEIVFGSLLSDELVEVFLDGVSFGEYLASDLNNGALEIFSSQPISTVLVRPNGKGAGDTDLYIRSISGTVVPEPTTLILLGSGFGALLFWRKRTQSPIHSRLN